MEIWCHKRIPVEGNFGQTYDSVNQSIHGLSGEFSANIDIKVGGQGVEEGEVQTRSRSGEGRKVSQPGSRQEEGQERGKSCLSGGTGQPVEHTCLAWE